MRYSTIFMVCFLGACCAACRDPPRLVIPEELSDCGYAPPSPKIPPLPRTIKQVADWANSNNKALDETRKILNRCRYKLRTVVHMVDKANSGGTSPPEPPSAD